jgi:hypothetical protein
VSTQEVNCAVRQKRDSPAASILLCLESVDLGGARRNGAFRDTVGTIIYVVVPHVNTVPVNRGTA